MAINTLAEPFTKKPLGFHNHEEETFENIVGKGKNAGDQNFLLL